MKKKLLKKARVPAITIGVIVIGLLLLKLLADSESRIEY